MMAIVVAWQIQGCFVYLEQTVIVQLAELETETTDSIASLTSSSNRQIASFWTSLFNPNASGIGNKSSSMVQDAISWFDCSGAMCVSVYLWRELRNCQGGEKLF